MGSQGGDRVKIGVSLKINVSAIDKARLFKGQKGTYLDCQTFINLNEQDEYGNNGFIAQSVSKEERQNGVKGNILGNVRVFFKDDDRVVPSHEASGGVFNVDEDGFESDIPF